MMIYDAFVRTIVDIPTEMIEGLAVIAEKERKSRAALIREAIAAYLLNKQPQDISAAFGIWADLEIDALDYKRAIRNEWERE